MRDEDKTREQLIEELGELNNRLEFLTAERTARLAEVNAGLRREIAERKQAEAALRESEEKYRSLFSNMDSGAAYHKIVVDEDSRPIDYVFLEVNNIFERLTGLSRESIIGRKVTESLPDIENSEYDWIHNYGKVALTGEPINFEQYSVPLDRWYSVSAYSPEKGYFVTLFHDITERKQMEEDVIEKHRLNALLLDSLPHPAMLIHKDRTVLAANQIALEVGARIGDYCWRSFGQSEFIPEQDKKYINDHNEIPPGGTHCIHCLADEVLENQEARNTEVEAWDKLWDTYWIPLDDEIYLHYAIDITERKKMQEEALKLDKLESIGILAGGIAHDLNNLLTGVMGNISLARMYDEPSKKDRRLVKAENASMRIKELTHQLLTFSRGGAPILQTADIVGLLTDSATFTLRGSNVRCDLSIPDNLWPVKIDAGQIDQVMNNLVINARQAMPNGGIVKIRGENITIDAESGLPLDAGTYIKVSVQDEGTGIPKDHLQNIFDPFFTTKQEGNGLGLATSYSIIQKHNGHIAVESQLGIGTTFHIYLPACLEEVAIKGKEEKVGPIMGTGRILIMDDEELIRELASNMLTNMGYRVTTVIDGARAIEAYKKAMESDDPYNAVIIDLTVPGGMGGEEAIERLAEIDPEIKAIVSSGYSNDPIMANFEEYGFKGFIPKPYKVGEVSEVLHRVLTKTRG